MSKGKGSGSCVGLVIKSWFASMFVLGGLLVLTVALGTHFLGWQTAPWTEVSSWTSYPVLAVAGIALLSLLASVFLSVLMSVGTALLGRGGSKGTSGGAGKAKARPQSHRKTTV